jgi:hypothetical protein
VAEVPAGFPTKLSDDELAGAIEKWIGEYRETYPTSKLPELILAFVNTASQEQLRREASAAARQARYLAGAALVVSLLSLVVILVK